MGARNQFVTYSAMALMPILFGLAFSGESRAQDVTCTVERERSIVSSIVMGGGVDAEAVVAGYEDVPNSRAACRVEAMVELATDARTEPDAFLPGPAACREMKIIGDRTLRLRQTVLLDAMAHFRQPWSVVRDTGTQGLTGTPIPPRQQQVMDRLVTAIACADELLSGTDNATERESLRAYRGAAEIAHANALGGYYSLLAFDQVWCGQARRKVSTARRNQKTVGSEFAVKAILVEASAAMTAASIEECDTHESSIDSVLKRIEAAFDERKFANSVEGWRWVNDLLAVEAVLTIAKGDQVRAHSAIERLENLGTVSVSEGYEELVHPEAARRLKEIDGDRSASGIEGYIDQVFYQRPITGMTVGNVVLERPYHSNRDVAHALRKTMQVNTEPCGENCLDLLKTLDRIIRENLARTDISVVAGSYIARSGAEQGLRSICIKLEQTKDNCRFEITELGRYHRISTEPIDEAAARGVASQLGALGLDHFLSRPRVIDPL